MNEERKRVTITHPAFGTVYMHDCTYKDGYVTGLVCIPSPTGDGHLDETMNFPVSCIRKEKVVDSN